MLFYYTRFDIYPASARMILILEFIQLMCTVYGTRDVAEQLCQAFIAIARFYGHLELD
jgi:hypothetical protein